MKIELFSGTGCRVTTEDGTDLVAWLQSQGIYCQGIEMKCEPGEVHEVRMKLVCFSAIVVIPEDMVTLRRTKYAESVGADQ